MKSGFVRPPLSLFPYLLMRVLPFAAITMAATGFIGLKITEDIAEERVAEQLLRQSEQTEKIIRFRLENIISQTANLSKNALLINGLIDFEGRQNYLPTFFRTYRLAGFTNAGLEMVDYKGRRIFSNFSDDDMHLQVNGWQDEVIGKSGSWSHLSQNGFISIEPIIYSGNAEGAVIATLNNIELSRLFNIGVQYSETVVIDAANEIIYSSKDEFGQAGKPFNFAGNQDVLMVSAPLKLFSEAKIVTLQWRDVALSTQQWMQNFLIIGILIALLVLGAAVALTAFIAKRDVSRLTTVVRKINDTLGMGQRVTPSGPAELYALGNDFNNMLETLQHTTTSFAYVDSIISNTAEGIITINSSGIIETFNLAAESIFGHSSEEAIGKSVSILMPADTGQPGEDDAKVFTIFAPDVINKVQIIDGLRRDGTVFPMELTTAQMDVEGYTKYTGIFRDISKRKQTEMALIENQQKAESANLAKSNFLSTMSHEIRTPLNGVLGLAQLLKDTKLDGDQESKVSAILSSGQTLLAILNDVLDMSKIEAGGLELEEKAFSLWELVSTITTPFQSLADDKGIELAINCDLTSGFVIKGDPVRLRQILWNLLSNAIKFTDEGHVNVSIATVSNSDNLGEVMLSPKDHLLCFSVEDTGAGIAPERMDAIFDAFTQEDSSITRKHGGTGLGLSIVKQLIELMGGTIKVDSELGKGTRFIAYIPFFAASVEVVEAISLRVLKTESQKLEPLNIIIAEDNEVNAVIAKAFLQKFGHSVKHVENGLLAVEAAKEGWADLILMDIHMPEMNGIEATKAICATETGKNVPIIGLTAEAFADRHAQFIEAGMVDVLTKPFTEQQLAGTLAANRLLDRRSKARGEIAETEEPSIVEAAAVVINHVSDTGAPNDDVTSVGNEEGLAGFREQLPGEVISKLLTEAQSSLQKHLSELQLAVQVQDSQKIREVAHSIKGFSGSMFATRVSEMAAEIEDMSDEIEGVCELMGEFEIATNDAIKWWGEQSI
ncbi:MAG: response regulator [Rhodospirillales bacterium]|nr:response regulator [Rhodospirillales bacterium]